MKKRSVLMCLLIIFMVSLTTVSANAHTWRVIIGNESKCGSYVLEKCNECGELRRRQIEPHNFVFHAADPGIRGTHSLVEICTVCNKYMYSTESCTYIAGTTTCTKCD